MSKNKNNKEDIVIRHQSATAYNNRYTGGRRGIGGNCAPDLPEGFDPSPYTGKCRCAICKESRRNENKEEAI